MSKGSRRRRSSVSEEELAANWESVFGPKRLNVVSDEEREEMLREKEALRRELEGE